MSRRTLWPLGLYTALSILLFGLPVLSHFGSHVIASDPVDSSQFMWFFAWWPHALLHGLNPFVTHSIFYPNGFNLTWATAMPGPSILLSPITLAFGPAVTWNVIQLASPALSAWTAFVLCRHLTAQQWPSLAGGYIFGFSPYMLVHLTGGPYLALVALLPVLVLLFLKRVEGSIGPRAFVIATALALTAQYSISSEILAMTTVFGAFALLVAYFLYRDHRQGLGRAIKLLVLAYGCMVVLISPFLLYFLFGHHYPPGSTNFEADVTAFVLPPRLVAAQLHSGPPFHGSHLETYLGVPLIVIVGLFVWRGRHERTIQLLGACLGVALIASLGKQLLVHGHKTGIPLPWALIHHLPVLRYAIPVRLALFVILPASVMVSMWLAEPSRGATRSMQIARWGLALLAIAFIVPAAGNGAWNLRLHDPPFFKHGAYRAYLNKNDHVLTVPVYGPNERWIADAGFPFALSAGYAGNPFPPSYSRYPTWTTLVGGNLTPDYAAQLRRFIADKRVTAIVVEQGYLGPWKTLFGSLGVRPIATGGVLLYRLQRPA